MCSGRSSREERGGIKDTSGVLPRRNSTDSEVVGPRNSFIHFVFGVTRYNLYILVVLYSRINLIQELEKPN